MSNDIHGIQGGTRRPQLACKNERWIYGFHLKRSHARRIKEKHGFDWKLDWCALDRADTFVCAITRVPFHRKLVHIRDRCSSILFFLEDDGRKRLDGLEFTEEDIDKVREAMELPKGAKPKWYCDCGVRREYEDKDGELSSDDEDWPSFRSVISYQDEIDFAKSLNVNRVA